jgi:predicted RNase H-like HicB family nuclease
MPAPKKRKLQFTALIERGDKEYVSVCPELDVASQGATVEEARANLAEAVELFLEHADEAEVIRSLETGKRGVSVENAPYRDSGFWPVERPFGQIWTG